MGLRYMHPSQPQTIRWKTSAQAWLIASLTREASQPEQTIWRAPDLAREAGQSLGILKSKRSWERFIASLSFLDVCSDESNITDENGVKVNALVIRQMIDDAQRVRIPVHFVAVNEVNETRVLVTASTKGEKAWQALPKSVSDPTDLLQELDKLVGPRTLVVPSGGAVAVLRTARDHLRAIGGPHEPSHKIDWFSTLAAFQVPLRPERRPNARRVTTFNSQISSEPERSRKAPLPNKSSHLSSRSTPMTQPANHQPIESTHLTHLDRLEAESIYIIREVMAHAENPVMLYSIGKDSSVMLHLARKAFYPSVPPFPLLHVDTRWKFQAMYDFRARMAEESGMELLVHINPEGVKRNINPFDHGSALHTDIMKTEGLKQALNEHRFDVAFGGARRDEEKSRAKERIFSFRNEAHRWDPKNQRPELWNLYNCRKNPGESVRVFPLSNWTELDIWQYIYRESIPIVPLYFAAERPVVERDGMLIMVDDDRMQLLPGEKITPRSVRFRTLGCYPLTGAIDSNAEDLADIVLELLKSTTSERQGRAIDTDSSGSMEKKKQEGYF